MRVQDVPAWRRRKAAVRRVECCVDKGIGEGWVVMLPGGGLILECDEESFGMRNEET